MRRKKIVIGDHPGEEHSGYGSTYRRYLLSSRMSVYVLIVRDPWGILCTGNDVTEEG